MTIICDDSTVCSSWLALCETGWTAGRLQRRHASWTMVCWSLRESQAVRVASTFARRPTAPAQALSLLISILEVLTATADARSDSLLATVVTGSSPPSLPLPFLHIPLYLHKATLLIRKPSRSLEERCQLAYWSLGPVWQSYIQFKSILVHCEPQKCFWWQKITGTYDYAVRSCWLGGGSQSGGVARSLKLQKWQPEM